MTSHSGRIRFWFRDGQRVSVCVGGEWLDVPPALHETSYRAQQQSRETIVYAERGVIARLLVQPTLPGVA